MRNAKRFMALFLAFLLAFGNFSTVALAADGAEIADGGVSEGTVESQPEAVEAPAAETKEETTTETTTETVTQSESAPVESSADGGDATVDELTGGQDGEAGSDVTGQTTETGDDMNNNPPAEETVDGTAESEETGNGTTEPEPEETGNGTTEPEPEPVEEPKEEDKGEDITSSTVGVTEMPVVESEVTEETEDTEEPKNGNENEKFENRRIRKYISAVNAGSYNGTVHVGDRITYTIEIEHGHKLQNVMLDDSKGDRIIDGTVESNIPGLVFTRNTKHTFQFSTDKEGIYTITYDVEIKSEDKGADFENKISGTTNGLKFEASCTVGKDNIKDPEPTETPGPTETPKPVEPEAETVTLTYTDGLPDEYCFLDQVFTIDESLPREEWPGCTRRLERNYYVFAGWSEPVYDENGNITLTAQWKFQPVADPTEADIGKAVKDIKVQCVAGVGHEDMIFDDLIPGSYTIGEIKNAEGALAKRAYKYASEITIDLLPYLEAYNADRGEHTLNSDQPATVTYILGYSDQWQAFAADGTALYFAETVTVKVKCEKPEPEPEVPEAPEQPTMDDLLNHYRIGIGCWDQQEHGLTQTANDVQYGFVVKDGKMYEPQESFTTVGKPYQGEDGSWYVKVTFDGRAVCELYSYETGQRHVLWSRDATSFTDTMVYSDGKWVRFERGKPIDNRMSFYFHAVCMATVVYVDGEANGEAFPQQEHKVPLGSEIPAFGEDPAWEGHIFKGWDPQLAETVDELKTYTYTAQWKDEETSPLVVRAGVFYAKEGELTSDLSFHGTVYVDGTEYVLNSEEATVGYQQAEYPYWYYEWTLTVPGGPGDELNIEIGETDGWQSKAGYYVYDQSAAGGILDQTVTLGNIIWVGVAQGAMYATVWYRADEGGTVSTVGEYVARDGSRPAKGANAVAGEGYEFDNWTGGNGTSEGTGFVPTAPEGGWPAVSTYTAHFTDTTSTQTPAPSASPDPGTDPGEGGETTPTPEPSPSTSPDPGEGGSTPTPAPGGESGSTPTPTPGTDPTPVTPGPTTQPTTEPQPTTQPTTEPQPTTQPTTQPEPTTSPEPVTPDEPDGPDTPDDPAGPAGPGGGPAGPAAPDGPAAPGDGGDATPPAPVVPGPVIPVPVIPNPMDSDRPDALDQPDAPDAPTTADNAPDGPEPVEIEPDDVPLAGLPGGDPDVDLEEEVLIDEEDTPLANGPLAHVCCILHLILALGAFVVAVYYTHHRKKHQEHEFDVREEIAEA